jgi:hypothetical protein
VQKVDDTRGAWIGRFRSDIEALARVEGEMPSPRELRVFTDEFEDALEPRAESTTDELWVEFSERWWKRFSQLEISRARRAVRLHVRLHELYRQLAVAPDEELASYARLRERARASAIKQLMTGLAAHPRERDDEDPGADPP